MMARFRFPSKVVHLVLIPILLALSLGAPGPAASKPAYTYANGIQLAAGAPLPVFLVSSIPVTPTVTLNLTQNFLGIYDRLNPNPDPGEDSFNNHRRFTYLNAANNTLLEQFGATGGFYAYNPSRAFGSEFPLGSGLPTMDQARGLACQFLLGRQNLIPHETFLEVPGIMNKCDPTSLPNFQVSTEWLTSQSTTPAKAPAAPSANTALRLMVTAPIFLHTDQWAPDSPAAIPLGGPGGRISMIFYNPPPLPAGVNAPAPSLDPNTPGLQAVAMPVYGRQFSFNRTAPAADPAAAQGRVLEMVNESYPGATNIKIPVPALEYFVSDPSTPQPAMEPDLVFSGVSLDIGGVTQTLKDIVLSGVDSGPGGLGPTVEVLSPANGAFYLPGGPVALQGKISDGKAPYSYDWQLPDGTSLDKGAAAAAGLLPLFSTNLPVPASKGLPGTLELRLVVTDTDQITRIGLVSLVAPMQLFLPTVMDAPPAARSTAKPQAAPSSRLAPNYTYSFGVEYGSDYPPYGPGGSDLGGVPPDANGLSAGFWSLGWPRKFNWYNSMAWERDWRDCSLGGSDCTYGVDRADFVYYSGHGNNGGIAVPSNTHDSSWFDGINARYQNARWVGFSSCLTLRAQWPTPGSEPIRRWFGAFQGAHMLLGFNSVMADIAFGGPLVDNMRMPTFFGIPFPWAQRTIAEAWVQTAFQMSAGKPAYIYAWKTGVDPSTNKLPQVGDPPLPRPYPVEWYFWVWWDE